MAVNTAQPPAAAVPPPARDALTAEPGDATARAAVDANPAGVRPLALA